MPSKNKNKGSWRQFDSKKGGGDGGSTWVKTTIVSIFFGLTMIITFIILILSFTQVGNHADLWENTNVSAICSNNNSRPARYIIPKSDAPGIIPTPTDPPTPPPTPAPPPPTPAPTPPTDAPTPAPTPTDPPTTAPTDPPTNTTASATGEFEEVEDEGGFENLGVNFENFEDENSRVLRDLPNITVPTYPPSWKKYFDQNRVLECGWPSHNSALRILASFLGLATCICVFWLVMRAEVWQAFWVCLVCSLFLVVFIFALFVNDANTLANSKKNCENYAAYLSQNVPSDVHVTCNMSPQIGVAVLNIVWLLWVPDAALLYLYVKSWKVVIYS